MIFACKFVEVMIKWYIGKKGDNEAFVTSVCIVCKRRGWIMSENKRVLTAGDLKALVRYEKDFLSLLQESEAELEEDFQFEGPFVLRAFDLKTAFERVRQQRTPLQVFLYGWAQPLLKLVDEEIVTISPGSGGIRYLSVTESEVLEEVLEDLGTMAQCGEPDLPAAESLLFQEIWELLTCYWHNRSRSPLEREYPAVGKESFLLNVLENEEFLQTATEEEVRLCRRFTDELAASGKPYALLLKAEGCYGGNRVFPCDFEASRACYEKLYEQTDLPYYAQRLGSIAYYGLCGGVPDYDRAFHYFSAAAAVGSAEAEVRLGDMYLNGQGCRKSPNTAAAIYHRVYSRCRRSFVEGGDEPLAEAALRMGDLYAQGLLEQKKPEHAYHYYMIARFALRRHLRESSSLQEVSTARAIRIGMDRIRKEIPPRKTQTRAVVEGGAVLKLLTEDDYRVQLSLLSQKGDSCEIAVQRLPRYEESFPKPVLVTLSQFDYCALHTNLFFRLRRVHSCSLPQKSAVVYDHLHIGWVGDQEEIVFEFNHRPVASLLCGAIDWELPTCPAEEEEDRLRFVSLRFPNDPFAYDFRCDVDSVRVGDRVAVQGPFALAEAEVAEVFTCRPGELVLPLDCYRRVVRKIL